MTSASQMLYVLEYVMEHLLEIMQQVVHLDTHTLGMEVHLQDLKVKRMFVLGFTQLLQQMQMDV